MILHYRIIVIQKLTDKLKGIQMETLKIKEPIYKIIIAIILEAIFLLGFARFEYGSLISDICGVLLILYFPICIIYCITKLRKSITCNGYEILVTPGLGLKKTYTKNDVKTVKILQNSIVEVLDQKSKTLFKYNEKFDSDHKILYLLKQNPNIIFIFEDFWGQFIIDKNRNILEEYFNNVFIYKRIDFSDYNEQETDEEFDDEEFDDEEFDDEEFDDEEFDEDEKNSYDILDNETRSRVEKIDSINGCVALFIGFSWSIITFLIVYFYNKIDRLNDLNEIIIFVGFFLFIPFFFINIFKNIFMKRKFDLLRNTFKRYKGKIINDEIKNRQYREKKFIRYKHIYEFVTDDEDLIKREGEDILPNDYAIGSRIGEYEMIWYSPCWENVIASDELDYNKRKKEKTSIKQLVSKHKLATIFVISFIISFVLEGYQICEYTMFKITTKDSAVTINFNDEDIELAEDEEEWLEYAFFPYFYAEGIFYESEYESFDVKHYKDVFSDYDIENMKDSLKIGWNITDRKSLLNTTKSLLKKGDRYTYYDNLHKLSPYRVTKKELAADEVGLRRALNIQENPWRNKYSHMGTYYAYNNAHHGVDAWDYCRCIRLFAFGYMCGYISYDEYLRFSQPLMTKLQEEYFSWKDMYTSYAYGYMIFAGRNKRINDFSVDRYVDMINDIYYDDIPIDFK